MTTTLNLSPDPLLATRAIVFERLSRAIPDEQERWRLSIAISNHLDMVDLIVPRGQWPPEGVELR
jgi:hypothetical protein